MLNMTPHPLNIHLETGEVVTLQPEGVTPRLGVEREELGHVNGIPVVRSTMGAPQGLPEQRRDTVIIVSALVAEHPALANRIDLACPGEAIRNENGQVVGCRGLCAGQGMAARMRKGGEA